jgi:hypothetical protein
MKTVVLELEHDVSRRARVQAKVVLPPEGAKVVLLAGAKLGLVVNEASVHPLMSRSTLMVYHRE